MNSEAQNNYWKCRQILKELNSCSPTNLSHKRILMNELFGKINNSLWIETPFFCDYGKNIFFDSNVFVNFNCIFLDVATITIGKNTLIAPNVQIYTASHPINASERLQYESGYDNSPSIKVISKSISIGENVWIGGNSIVLPGVTIGNNVTIGAGSIVNKNIPDNVLACGNPCKVIRRL